MRWPNVIGKIGSMCLPTGTPAPFAWSSTRAALCKRYGVHADPRPPAAVEAAPAAHGVELTDADLQALVKSQQGPDGAA